MRIVVLVSGSGSNLQAVIDAVSDGTLNVTLAAVGADRPGTGGVQRAADAGIATFEVDFRRYPDRAAWNRTLTDVVAAHEPDYVVSSGFMRIVDQHFLDRFPDRYLNTHPALLPSFPGAHGVRDALAYGVKVTGCTVMIADAGVDTGPILAQAPVAVLPDDTEATLHERIKVEERRLLIETLAGLAASDATSAATSAASSEAGA
jgi:phosphoribosylglycinamide formyltransferase-1